MCVPRNIIRPFLILFAILIENTSSMLTFDYTWSLETVLTFSYSLLNSWRYYDS